MSSTSLRMFDITKIKHNNVVVLIGMRETGKSFLVKDILWHHRDISCGVVISGTEGANHFYGKMIHPRFIHDEYSPQIIVNVLKRQKLIAKKISSDLVMRGTTDVDPRTFLILDDCLYDSSWIHDPNVQYLFMNGRHIHTMFLITMLYPMGIPPALRAGIDYVFILRENIPSNHRRLYEQYGDIFPDFESFCKIMNQFTDIYVCLVIDNTIKGDAELEDRVFWYKASAHSEFHMCSE